ncbi:hypothetical protein ACFWXO_39090 [Kitasatospora sp. NPDC059088]|uniref:hypothetical protein n=1 Tax=Kitasatospora sp. NPDC059088 TaxID=3346722 RepID=UPI003688DEE3
MAADRVVDVVGPQQHDQVVTQWHGGFGQVDAGGIEKSRFGEGPACCFGLDGLGRMSAEVDDEVVVEREQGWQALIAAPAPAVGRVVHDEPGGCGIPVDADVEVRAGQLHRGRQLQLPFFLPGIWAQFSVSCASLPSGERLS